MKNLLCILLFVGVFQNILFAQDTQQKPKIQTWLYLQNPKSKFQVELEQLKDSSILVCFLDPPAFNSYDIPISRIEGIKWHKKNQTWKGIGLGAACGLGLGFLVDIISAPELESSDPLKFGPKNQVKYGIWGGFTGALLGGLIGSVDMRISINGSQFKYRNKKAKLRQLITCSQ